EIPENVSLKLPDNGGNLLYVINKIDNKLQVMFHLKLAKTEFTSYDYVIIKEFYAYIASILSKKVLLSTK
ncbi:MAG: hypothetical protein K8R53_13970, partial [Bacteroidales bacterium]|nr:hypothetical protein [Bacteroidales bacterium]